MEKSLFLVGEIGGDELAYGFIQGKTIQELRTMVPDIVHAIIRGVTVSIIAICYVLIYFLA